MSFSTEKTENYLLFDTAVDNLYISEYMPGAPGDYVKAYLSVLLRVKNGLPTDDESVAKASGLSVKDVERAWEYWEEQGILRKKYLGSEKTRFDYELVSVREELFGRGGGSRSKKSSPRAVSLGSEELAKLFKDIEAATGRLLEASEPEAVSSWIAEYGIEPAVIVLGYKYCRERGKSDRWRYVAKVVKDWRAKGLNSVSEVEEYLSGMDKHYSMYRTVFRELGFSRNPSEPEKRIMDSWFDEMGLSLDSVLAACAKTTGIANPNLNYVNSVLVSEYKKRRGEKTEAPSEDIERIYARIREENAEKTEETRRKIFAEIPELERISREISKAGAEIPGLMLSGGGKAAVSALREKMESLKEKKADLLRAAGYSEDTLNEIYTCKECKDTGLLEDGTRCRCYGEKLKKLLLRGRKDKI